MQWIDQRFGKLKGIGFKSLTVQWSWLKTFFFLGGYVHWDYEDKTAIGYCPYIPFVFSFGILLIFWIVVCVSLIVCLTVECIGKVIYPKYHKQLSTTQVQLTIATLIYFECKKNT